MGAGRLQPDLTLIFDAPVEIAQRRLHAATPNPDRFEQEQAAFFERVRAAYLRIARENPAARAADRCNQTPEQINKSLEKLIATILIYNT
jgi:dTMP kinase